MKKFSTISLVLLIALAFFACEEPKDNPKQQTATRTLAHGVGTVTVTGYMTNAQWAGVADKVAGRINGGIDADITAHGEQLVVSTYTELFGREVTYIVEPNPVGYSSYKLTGDGKTVYIAFDKVDTTVPGGILIDLYQNRKVVDGMVVQ